MKKEVKIGITVLFAFVILIWGVNFLRGRDIFQVGDYYYGTYVRIDGLTKASPVFYRGFKIGNVRNIDFHPSQANRFLVTFELNKDVLLPRDSRAQIYSLDLMGSKGVQFIPGTDSEMLAIGDTMNTSVMGDLKDQVSMEVLPLKDKAERLIVQLDSVFTNLSDLVDEENRANYKAILVSFRRSMQNFEAVSSNLAQQMAHGGDMAKLISRTDSVMMMLNSQAPYMDTVFQSMSGFSRQLENSQIDQSLEALNTTLNSTTRMLASLNESEGSLGLLMNDKELYYSLTEVSASLNRLLIDVRHNPKRYVSFSAIDMGKKVHVSDGAYGIKGVFFQVLLQESKKPLKMDSLVMGYEVIEDYRKSKYYYSIAQSRNFDEIQKICDKSKSVFKDSKVVAFENGEPISLRKAQRKVQ